ncbi:BGTF surface domain-containing protein [Natronobacterium texcoconense]|uniref:BGTF surface domain-containing protein n=1 Tax=Natronobacterium texcoconense TaxID=1095778 RepID=UPI001FCD4A1E|nr:BGTF surface domain-containing protein [Natronobacterium texcoconense]
MFLAAIMIVSVFAMSAAFAGTAVAEDPEGETLDQAYDAAGPTWTDGDVETVYIGQEITIEDESLASESSVILYEGPASLDDPERAASIQIHHDQEEDRHWGEFETADLEPGEAYHFVAGDSEFDEKEFWTAEEELDVEFEVNTVTQDDTVDLEFDSERDVQHLNVTSEEFDGGELDDLFNYTDEWQNDYTDDVLTLENVSAGEDIEVDFDDIEPGDYEFEFETTDSLAWDNATIEVVDDDASVDFADDIGGERGDVIDITLDLEHVQTGAVQIGDFDEDNFQAAAHFDVDDYSADEITLRFDTYAPNDGEDSWSVHPDDADEYDAEILEGYTAINFEEGEPLGVHDYEIIAGTSYDEGDAETHAGVEEDSETDTSFFSVFEPEPVSNVDFEIAPAGTDLGDYDEYDEAYMTSSSEVAYHDELVVTIEDFGLSGAVDGMTTDDVGEMLEEAGMEITVEEQDPGPNVDPKVWSTAAEGDEAIDVSAVYTDLEYYDGDLVATLDYTEADEFDVGGYDLTLEISEDSMFADDEDEEIEIESSFEVVEPELDLHPDNDEIPNSDEAEVIGTTTVAPGSDISTGASSAGNFTDGADAVVDDDRTFTAVYDFSDYEAGIEFDLEAEHDDSSEFGEFAGDLEDDMSSVLVDAEDPLINLNADAPDEVEPGEDAALDVTVSNDGGAADDVDVVVTLDGEELTDETITLDAGDTWSESFDFDTAEEGDIDWDVTAGDESDSGTLTVAEEEEEPEPEPEPEDDDDDDDGDEDGTPGFGVAVAVVALLAAAMLALRRQD